MKSFLRKRFSSLRARLTLLTIALVALTSLIVGVLTFVNVQQSLESQFNTALRAVGDRVQSEVRQTNGQFSGQGIDPGTVVVGLVTSTDSIATNTNASSGLLLVKYNQTQRLTGEQLRQILSHQSSTGTFEANLPDRGPYRFVSAGPYSGPSTSLVVGSPLHPVQTAIAAELARVALLILVATIVAGLLGAAVVDRALRPLRRVAGVATRAAALPLDRDDVQVEERVTERDTEASSEVGQVGNALNTLLDSVSFALAVRQASETKVRRFVADASHELRTPLAAIRGYAEITRRFSPDLDPDSSRNIERIESEAKRMTQIVEDLLLLARLDAERELERLPTDIAPLVIDALRDAQAAGPDHQWTLEHIAAPAVAAVDAARIQQVIVNLLANARVHTPAGTTVRVSLTADETDSTLELAIEDNGPGIPETLQSNLFERFIRGDDSRHRATGSTGLGLSIVKTIVEAHGGTVSVESRPGTTRFLIKLAKIHTDAEIPTFEPVE